MIISLPSWYYGLTEDKKNDFLLTWITSNKGNLRIVVNGNKVEGYCRSTGELLAKATVDGGNLEYYKILQDDYEPTDFNIRFTVKPGEPAYVVQPKFKDMLSGDTSMTFDVADIKKVRVVSVSGADDLSCAVNYITMDEDCEKSGIVQEAVFAFYTDAVEACKACIGKNVESWGQFIELAAKSIHYRYKLELPVKRGEKAYILDRFKYNVKSSLDVGDAPVYKETKFTRVVMSNLSNDIEVQTVGELYYNDKGHLVDNVPDKEVVVKKRKSAVLSYVTFYGALEVVNLIGTYKVPMDMVKITPI